VPSSQASDGLTVRRGGPRAQKVDALFYVLGSVPVEPAGFARSRIEPLAVAMEWHEQEQSPITARDLFARHTQFEAGMPNHIAQLALRCNIQNETACKRQRADDIRAAAVIG